MIFEEEDTTCSENGFGFGNGFFVGEMNGEGYGHGDIGFNNGEGSLNGFGIGYGSRRGCGTVDGSGYSE